MMPGARLLFSGGGGGYRRQVAWIDTNGGGCTMDDIVLAPTPGFRLRGRFAYMERTGDCYIGNPATRSTQDSTCWRFFVTGGTNGYMDLAYGRMCSHGAAASGSDTAFHEVDVLMAYERGDSHFKTDGTSSIDEWGPRYGRADAMPLTVCKYGRAPGILGRLRIAWFDLMQDGETVADFIAVETADGRAGLYDRIGGGVYTSTAGREFALP